MTPRVISPVSKIRSLDMITPGCKDKSPTPGFGFNRMGRPPTPAKFIVPLPNPANDPNDAYAVIRMPAGLRGPPTAPSSSLFL